MRLPEQYERWQNRLANEFFRDRANQPVVLFVDRGVLQELAEPGEDGARALAAAVRELVDIRLGRRMFVLAERAHSVWRRGMRDCPPPTLPVLALSVLAASEMSRDGAVAGTNYYIPLARAFLPDGSEEEISALRDVLRGGGAFTSVSEMWGQLDRWMTETGGDYGISTIRDHPELTRIGYPLSQTLVRKSDRAALTRFFDRLNLSQERLPSPPSLMSMLKVWTSTRSQGLSERFLLSLSEPSLNTYMQAMVHQLAEAWDGKIITAEGLRRLDLRLVVDLDRSTAWWVIPAVRDIVEDSLSGVSGGVEFTALLGADPYSSMFTVVGLPSVTAEAVSSGFSVRGRVSVAEFQPSRLIVLADSADAGGWISVDALQPYEEHALIVAAESVSVVERALQDAADSGWQRVDRSISEQLLPGYAIFYRVTFSNQDALEKAMAALPVSVASNLRVGANVRPRLVNGLPVLREIGTNIYFPGGEPDLALPVGAEPRKTDVTLDGMTESLLASIFPFPISRFGPWTEGPHRVEADGDELTFVVAPGAADDRTPSSVGTLGWVGGVLRNSTADEASICGAICSGASTERPPLARRGAAQSILILPSGKMTELVEPPLPNCFDGVAFPLFEVEHPKAVWLAQRRRDRWSVKKLRVQEPNFQGLSMMDRRYWAELSEVTVHGDSIWQMYRKAWERFNAR